MSSVSVLAVSIPALRAFQLLSEGTVVGRGAGRGAPLCQAERVERVPALLAAATPWTSLVSSEIPFRHLISSPLDSFESFPSV